MDAFSNVISPIPFLKSQLFRRRSDLLWTTKVQFSSSSKNISFAQVGFRRSNVLHNTGARCVPLFEDDIKNLPSTHKVLAECILNDPEARSEAIGQVLDELAALRLQANETIGLLAAIVESSDDAIL